VNTTDISVRTVGVPCEIRMNLILIAGYSVKHRCLLVRISNAMSDIFWFSSASKGESPDGS
jgi:hypothetical protein